MERQYIGARYVPIFFENPTTGDATWLSGVAYEGLTIVTYAGNSYTSKKPVPAGIGAPNLNPEYWVSTGNYNAQIEEVQEEIAVVRTEIAEAQEDITDIGNRFPIKPSNVSPRQYILIADSFGNPTTIGGNPWIYYFESLAGVTEGETAFSGFSTSGGFVHSGSNGTYLDVLSAITNSGVISDPNAITDILVQTGGNDWESTATAIRSALVSFCEYAKQHYPYAKINIAVTSKFNTNNLLTAVGIKYTVIPALKNNVYIGYHYITNSEYIMQILDVTDGTHPNQANSELLAGYLYSGVIGGSVSIQFRSTPSAGFTPSRTGGIAFTLTREMNNNNIAYFNALGVIGEPLKWTLFNDTASPLTGYSWFNGISFGSFPTSLMRPMSAPSFSTFLQLETVENGMLTVPATLTLQTNADTGVVDLLITTGRFLPANTPINITRITTPKITFAGLTEWLL